MWMSISPGARIASPKSTTSPLRGTVTAARGPTAAIMPSSINSAALSIRSSGVSNCRARRTVVTAHAVRSLLSRRLAARSEQRYITVTKAGYDDRHNPATEFPPLGLKSSLGPSTPIAKSEQRRAVSNLVVNLDHLLQLVVAVHGRTLASLQLADFFLERFDFRCYGRKRLGEGVVDLLGIGDHHALAGAKNDVSGHAHYGGVIRNITQHHRAGTDAAVLANYDVAQHLRARADNDIVADCRMALAALLAGAAQGHALIQRHIITDDRSLANNHAHSVIDEEPAADLRAGMNLDASYELGELRQRARHKEPAANPQPVVKAVSPQRMQPRVEQHNLERGPRRRIAFFDSGDIFTHGCKHVFRCPRPPSPMIRCAGARTAGCSGSVRQTMG